jgi:hypothetical protein
VAENAENVSPAEFSKIDLEQRKFTPEHEFEQEN